MTKPWLSTSKFVNFIKVQTVLNLKIFHLKKLHLLNFMEVTIHLKCKICYNNKTKIIYNVNRLWKM